MLVYDPRPYPNVWFIGDTSRIVLPSNAEITGIIISNHPTGESDVPPVKVVKLARGCSSGGLQRSYSSFGYWHALFFEGDHKLRSLKYNWPDDEAFGESEPEVREIEGDVLPPSSYRTYMADTAGMGRIVSADPKGGFWNVVERRF